MLQIPIRSKTLSALFGAFALGIALSTALPATGAQPGKPAVAPFGFAIGKANLSEVRESLKGRVSLGGSGTNRYSNGPMFTAPGDGFDIEGLQQVLFVFDERGTLVALQMTLGKNGFEQVYQNLAEKYPLVRKDIPFVGSKYARFQQGDAVIELAAPHMSFETNVIYMTVGFERQIETVNREEKAQKQKREAGRF